jgi:rfaE bifunctional protein nucleotidyltransferase chain/domain
MKIIVNGTFDILHRGHLELLQFAKNSGFRNYLLVAIDTDRRVKELKGSDRPINNQNDRRFMLQNLKPVDLVRFFDSDEELVELIKSYQPDIMVKGNDWRGKTIVGQEYVKEIIYYDRISDYSTTKTIQNIISRR